MMSRRIRYHHLPTEQSNPRSRNLDQFSTSSLLQLINREDAAVVHAVQRQLPQIARAVKLIACSLQVGGGLFFVGAGTSGRLGVIEAAECPPTFHTTPSMIQAIIAGGPSAVFRSQEGAEDDAAAAKSVVQRLVHRGDVVVGIAASGVTPFVGGALRAAIAQGAKTILLTCHPRAAIRANIRISLVVGSEVLTGSTRLKAGTATKLVLNMLTLGAMVRLGKTYGNLMVDVRPTSRKLYARAIQIIRSLTQRSAVQAEQDLRAAHGNVKIAVLMVRRKLTYPAARKQLARVGGSLRRALR